MIQINRYGGGHKIIFLAVTRIVKSNLEVFSRCSNGHQKWIRHRNRHMVCSCGICRRNMKETKLDCPRELRATMRNRWNCMKQRCLNPNNTSYKAYGARGIKIHADFLDFPTYVKYVMSLPGVSANKEIDRIDNNGNYEPGNLRWVDRLAQSRNRKANRYIEWEGKMYMLCDIVRGGIIANGSYHRYRNMGMPDKDIIEKYGKPDKMVGVKDVKI